MPLLPIGRQRNSQNEKIVEENDNKHSKPVSGILENDRKKISTTTQIRSILRKRVDRRISTNADCISQRTSILLDESDDNDKSDSHYNIDDNETYNSNVNNKDVEEKDKNQKEHDHKPCHEWNDDKLLQKLSSASSVFPLKAIKAGRETPTHTTNNQSLNRNACVTFSKDQATIMHQNSSTIPLQELNNKLQSSIPSNNVQTDASTPRSSMPCDFHPVYVPPFKYRPLLGLSSNDSRILLEKRVSLLGKPLISHSTQKRSPAYRRTQLRIYNFLERAHGYKAMIYHALVYVIYFCLKSIL